MLFPSLALSRAFLSRLQTDFTVSASNVVELEAGCDPKTNRASDHECERAVKRQLLPIVPRCSLLSPLAVCRMATGTPRGIEEGPYLRLGGRLGHQTPQIRPGRGACGFCGAVWIPGKKTKTKNYTIICPDPVAAAIFPSVKRPPEAVPGTSSTGLYLYFDGTSSQVEGERERQGSYKNLRILSCSLGRSR